MYANQLPSFDNTGDRIDFQSLESAGESCFPAIARPAAAVVETLCGACAVATVTPPMRATAASDVRSRCMTTPGESMRERRQQENGLAGARE